MVLFTLIPSQFETPVSQDSIFAPAFEAEEALPADEIEAKTRVPSTQLMPSKPSSVSEEDFAEPAPEVESFRKSILSKPTSVSPKKKAKVAPVKELRAESAPRPPSQVQREQEKPSEDVFGVVDKQFERLDPEDDLMEFEAPLPKTSTLNEHSPDVADAGGTNSLEYSQENPQNTGNDLNCY